MVRRAGSARLDDERPCQRHALSLAAGKLADATLLEPFGSDRAQGTPCPLAAGLVDAAHAQAELHITDRVEMREEGEALKNKGDVALIRRNPCIGCPRMMTSPASSWSSPAIMRMVVVCRTRWVR